MKLYVTEIHRQMRRQMLSQADLARKANIKPSTLSKALTRGAARPGTVKRLTEALLGITNERTK